MNWEPPLALSQLQVANTMPPLLYTLIIPTIGHCSDLISKQQQSTYRVTSHYPVPLIIPHHTIP